MSPPTTPTRSGSGPRPQFTPTRPAPSPPTYSSLSTSPFTTYVPHHHIHPRVHHSHSYSSLDSTTTLNSPTSSNSTSSRSGTQHTYTHADRSPLDTPLTRSPHRPNTQNHYRPISYPSPSSSSSRTYPRLPAELSLFDHRPRQSLLADLECILGKKLHFPTLSPSKRKLKKEKRISEDDVFWSGMEVKREEVVVIEKKKGRGVREGNWI